MAEKKIYLTDDDKATFQCPACETSRVRDVSKYKNIDRAVRVKVKCTCGHVYTVLLERRQFFRKTVHLSGKILSDGKHPDTPMTVKDISRTGLKIEMDGKINMEKGEKLAVEFHLDDKPKSLIRKEGYVKSIRGKIVGIEFRSSDSDGKYDQAIRMYMFSQ